MMRMSLPDVTERAGEDHEVQEELAGAVSWIMDLDRLIHEPSRLAVLTLLRASGQAEYLYLKKLTGLSKGNLSNHLVKLEDAGLVEVRKHFEGKKPVTTVLLIEKGRATIESYWTGMEQTARASDLPRGAGIGLDASR